MSICLDTKRSHFEDELVEVEEVVVDELLHLTHIEMHLAAVAGHQVGTQQQSLGLQELEIVDFILFDN
jgi:hypothetical protein